MAKNKQQPQRVEMIEEALEINNGLATFRVHKDLMDTLGNAPEHVFGILRIKYAALQSEGLIEDFEILEEELRHVFDHLQKFDLPQEIKVIVGVGGDRVEGINIVFAKGKVQKANLRVTLRASKLQELHPRWITAYVNDKLLSKDFDWKVDPAIIESIRERRSKLEESIVHYPLGPIAEYAKQSSGGEFNIKVNEETGDLVVLLGGTFSLSLKEIESAIVAELRQVIEVCSFREDNTGIYKIFQRHIRNQIKIAYSGPQVLGFSLPHSFIGAIRLQQFPHIPDTDPLLSQAYLLSVENDLTLDPAQFIAMQASSDDLQRCAQTFEQQKITGQSKESGKLISSKMINLLGMRSASNNQSYCQRSLEAAKVAILECLHANRDYKTLMIGFSKKELPEFFKRYQTFKNSVAKLINASKGQELYQFNLQFFPLTSTSPKSTQSVTNHHEDFADSHWCKLLIREMACLPGANDDPSWFAHHIIPDLPLEDVKKSVKALISKGFIAVDKKSGRLSQTKKDVIAEDPSYTNGTQFHRDVLDLALHTNLGEKKAHCDISATTFATDKETRVLLQKKYDQFLYGIFKSAGETSEPDYIYQVSLQLFPLMKSAT